MYFCTPKLDFKLLLEYCVMNLLDYECPHHILDNRTKETSEVTSAIFLDMSTEWVYYTVWPTGAVSLQVVQVAIFVQNNYWQYC